MYIYIYVCMYIRISRYTHTHAVYLWIESQAACTLNLEEATSNHRDMSEEYSRDGLENEQQLRKVASKCQTQQTEPSQAAFRQVPFLSRSLGSHEPLLQKSQTSGMTCNRTVRATFVTNTGHIQRSWTLRHE